MSRRLYHNPGETIEFVRKVKTFDDLAIVFARLFTLADPKEVLRKAKVAGSAMDVLRDQGKHSPLDISAAGAAFWMANDPDVREALNITTTEAYALRESVRDVTPGAIKADLDAKGSPLFEAVKVKMDAISDATNRMLVAREKVEKAEEAMQTATWEANWIENGKDTRQEEVYRKIRDIQAHVRHIINTQGSDDSDFVINRIKSLREEEAQLSREYGDIAAEVRSKFNSWRESKALPARGELKAAEDAVAGPREEIYRAVLDHLTEASGISQEESEAWARQNIVVGDSEVNKLKRLKYLLDDFYRDCAEFYRMCGGNIGPVQFGIKRGDRSDAQGKTLIRIADGFDKGVLWHELGHVMEAWEPAINDGTKSFIEARAKGPAVWLGPGYKKDERAYPDDFIDKYVGKAYGNASEVISMGVQQLAKPESTLAFLAKDPEHFRLIAGACLHRNEFKREAMEKMQEQTKVFLKQRDVLGEWTKALDKASRPLVKLLTEEESMGFPKGGGYRGFFISAAGTRGSLWCKVEKWTGSTSGGVDRMASGKIKTLAALVYLLLAFEDGTLPVSESFKEIPPTDWEPREFLNSALNYTIYQRNVPPKWWSPDLKFPKVAS